MFEGENSVASVQAMKGADTVFIGRRVLLILFSLLVGGPAWGAVATDVIVSTDASSSSTSITTPSFSTTAANELLLAFIATDGTLPGVTVTGVTGAGLT